MVSPGLVRKGKKTIYRNGKLVQKGYAPVYSKRRMGGVKGAFAQKVKSVLLRAEETKYRAEDLVIPGSILPSLGTFQQFSSGITGTGELYACIPRITQGTNDFNRIGNRISPVSCHVDAILNCTTSNNNQSVDVFAHVFVLEATAVKSLDNLSAVPITQLLEDGAGGYIAADGTTNMTQYPVNRTAFKVLHHRRMRLYKPFGQQNNRAAPSAGGTDGTIAACTGNKRIRLKIPLPKELRYDVAAQDYPVNTAPFFCVAWEYNDQSGDSAPITSIYVQARTHLRYKDA